MNNLTVLKTNTASVSADLRKLADEIDAGKHDPSSAIVVMRSRHDACIMRTFCGEQMSYSSALGLLSYASHMVYAECRREAGDG